MDGEDWQVQGQHPSSAFLRCGVSSHMVWSPSSCSKFGACPNVFYPTEANYPEIPHTEFLQELISTCL